ncbi:MAG: gliding motility protein GldL [Paludibacteraceae bacterium]|nr:gliding motility protein GldL [Paludibacteraceae bacterium]
MAKQQELKGWDKVVAWYAANSYTIGMVYNIGASVVIIGALFKIMHWPGAGYVLTAGMFTEAFLFFIGIFEKPHAVYNWETVFPQLLGHEEHPLQENLTSAPKRDNNFNALSEGDLRALKDGIGNLTNAANQLADLSKLAEGSARLGEKLQAAADVTDKFAYAQNTALAGVDRLGEKFAATARAIDSLKADAEGAAKEQAAARANLASINAAYELNLRAVQAITADAQKLADASANATKASEAYAAAQSKLTQQVADLNKVYGNMLNALA